MMWESQSYMRCVIYGIILLLLKEVGSVDDQACSGDILEADKRFYNGTAHKLSPGDKLGLFHGDVSNKRCKYIKSHVRDTCSSTKTGCQSQSTQHRERRSDLETECSYPALDCNPFAEFRTIDGSCNNLNNPHWGKGNRIQRRLLDPEYQDGKGVPKKDGCNGPLPSPRLISNIIHSTADTTDLDKKHSVFIMLFGQFLAHDISQTPMSQKPNGDALECCDGDLGIDACDTIAIPDDDPHFMPRTCMSFPRSVGRLDCDGVRQQFNKHSAYLDLSMAYGTNDDLSMSLRELDGGRLKSVMNTLPVDESSSLCELSEPANPPIMFCPMSGDSRVIENPTLAALHVIPHREHNRLANGLASINPFWDDERLFQVARKINIAQWQHIVYNEYLPATLGTTIMEEYGIDVEPTGYKDTYDELVDATVVNAFSTAAFRFGHSLIPQVISMVGFNFLHKRTPEQLHDHFFKADLYHLYDKKGLEYLLMGMATSTSPSMDRKFEDSVRNNLFHDGTFTPFDLVALNIQRGRDHGLPGYNEYREYCQLSRASTFDDLEDHTPAVRELFQQVYNCTDDIDLYSGLVSEKPAAGSQVGPLAQCLIAEQFKVLRDGDRMFYDRPFIGDGFQAFTEAQLNEIKKIRMSTLFCLNTDADKIQGNMFLRAARGGKSGPCNRHLMSELEDCSSMEGINLDLWRDIR